MALIPVHPVLLHIGPLVLPTFGALLAAGLLLSLTISLRTAALAGLSPDRLWRAGLFAVLAAFVASRVMLVIDHPRIFARYPLFLLAQPSLTATGLLLAAVATLVFLRREHLPLRRVLEAWTSPGLLLWAFLALGHLFEGSDPGMPTRAPWGVRMPGAASAEQPVALLLAVCALLLAVATCALLRRGLPAAAPGLAGAGLVQVLSTFLRQPATVSFAGLDAIQWLGLGLIAAGAAAALLPRRVRGVGAAY